MFRKFARADIISDSLGTYSKLVRKASSNKSIFRESNLSTLLQQIYKPYAISNNPKDYIWVVARALTDGKENENLDCFGGYELLSLKKNGKFCYETFQLDPHLTEHDDSDLRTANGFIADAVYSDETDDKFVACLLGIDKVKRPKMAKDLMNGITRRYSMGCLCEQTRCSSCGNVASTEDTYCQHIRNKYLFGKASGAFEWCEGVTFRELSDVGTPADRTAESLQVCYAQNNGKIICR